MECLKLRAARWTSLQLAWPLAMHAMWTEHMSKTPRRRTRCSLTHDPRQQLLCGFWVAARSWMHASGPLPDFPVAGDRKRRFHNACLASLRSSEGRSFATHSQMLGHALMPTRCSPGMAAKEPWPACGLGGFIQAQDVEEGRDGGTALITEDPCQGLEPQSTLSTTPVPAGLVDPLQSQPRIVEPTNAWQRMTGHARWKSRQSQPSVPRFGVAKSRGTVRKRLPTP